MSKKLFNLDDYKNTEKIRYGMWCKTEDEARIFCNFLDSQGRKLQSGNSYKEEINRTWFADNYGGVIYYFNEGLYSYLFRLNQCTTSNVKKAILKFSDYTYPNEDENEDDFENDVNFNLKCDIKLNPETYKSIVDRVNSLIEKSLIKEYGNEQKEKDNNEETNEEIVDNNKEENKRFIPEIVNCHYEELTDEMIVLLKNGDKISVSNASVSNLKKDFDTSDLFYIAVAQLATGCGEMGIKYLPEIEFCVNVETTEVNDIFDIPVVQNGREITIIFCNGDEISVFLSNCDFINDDFKDDDYLMECMAIAKYAMGGDFKMYNLCYFWSKYYHRHRVYEINRIKQAIDEYNSNYPDIQGRELVLDFKEKESENT